MTLSNAVLTFLLLLNSKSLVKADETSIEDFFWSQDENYIWPGLPKHAPYDIKGYLFKLLRSITKLIKSETEGMWASLYI